MKHVASAFLTINDQLCASKVFVHKTEQHDCCCCTDIHAKDIL
ncbi:hypothetical protein EV13_0229 [Prochlorococcus sp. MIT 0702]|nr:hypothetical protein EV12_1840 [Prochlorococcus sp. MIT 0701]KGG30466.1 hypothetical protein EV13_0229 [Prochlorococcus sp. MIT 0702]KGG33996.1 hypothetical protein EV14_1536 [Prochlorococcus sp. MIT 0703]